LPEDTSAVDRFNLTAQDDHRLQLGVLPEPFLGRPDAPVVVLGLNPGWKQDADPVRHANQAFRDCSRANLVHAPADYPFYLLNPHIDTTQYWHKMLKPLKEAVGLEAVARGVLCVELFPYHSRKFHRRLPRIPSQEYSFGLVRQAMMRAAVIIQLRGEDPWMSAIPELASYARRFGVNSVQNPTVSPKNCPEGYRLAVEVLRAQFRATSSP